MKNHPSRARNKVVSVNGFQQVVVGLLTQRIHSILVVRRRVHQEKISVFQAVDQLDSRTVGHVDVHEHHVGGQFADQPLGLTRRRGRLEDVQRWTQPLNLTAEKVTAMGFVVHDEGMKLSEHRQGFDPRKGLNFPDA
jgi:hypothetical protein